MLHNIIIKKEGLLHHKSLEVKISGEIFVASTLSLT